MKLKLRRRHGSHNNEREQEGILLVEVVLAVAIFGLIALIVISAFTYGRESTAIGGDNSRGAEVANTAVEALHNIAQSSYSNLSTYTNGTTYYLNATGSQWALTSAPTTVNGIYTPSIVFSAGPNNSRQATITVTWKESVQRTGTITTTTYLANYATATSAAIKTGLLVYANGGTTSNLITYRLLQSNGLWANPLPLPTAGNSNYVARSVKLYTAQTGTTKMVIARFFDGTKQYLYAYYWTGTAWNNPQLLSSWTSNGALDSGNFSGTWLANGKFLVVYSDNTNFPKYNTYSSGAWSAQGSMGQVSSSQSVSPTSMIVRARPGTSEAMMALLTSNYQTITDYYSNGNWAPIDTHASNGTSNGTHDVDFDWTTSDNIHGALLYTKGSSDRSPSVRIFTADGSGSGSWGTTFSGANQPAGSVVDSVVIAGQTSGGANWIACDKDGQNTPHIFCYTVTTSTITTPTNQLIAPATATGGQQSVDLDFEDLAGNVGLAAYADGGTSPKMKRFFSATNTWDANPIASSSAASNIEKTRNVAEPGLNDSMVLAIDTQNNLYSNMFNGTSSTFYSSPAGYAWTIHNANGPSTAAKWFDFGWDN